MSHAGSPFRRNRTRQGARELPLTMCDCKTSFLLQTTGATALIALAYGLQKDEDRAGVFAAKTPPGAPN